ncbi:MAG TPA: type II toxin-antitoxin system RelE/ParE family toxin [Candidatus Paceibacterota bacterium]
MKTRFLQPAKEFIDTLPIDQRAKLAASISVMVEGHLELARTKSLRGKIRELIVKNSRFTFFVIDETIYFVNGFIKKSNKTPKSEIDYAEKVYKLMMNN